MHQSAGVTKPGPIADRPAEAHGWPLRAHVLLTLLFVSSRLTLQYAGIRFNFSLDWMWLSDPADLRDRLLETLYYFHAFPPGMDFITGVFLKLGGSHAATLALITFWLLGFVIVNALFYLLRVSGLSVFVALGVSVAFSLIPQSIYFENLYLYEYPIAALLCLAAVFFYKAVQRQSFWAWLAFFCVCSAIGLTRTTFHLLWFVAMVGLGVWFSPAHVRVRLLRAACAPAALLLALYIKNFAVFGVFDAFTFGPVSQDLVTIWHLPVEVRDSWIKEGKLSPFAAVSVYAGPREYLPFFATSENKKWPPQLNLLERPSVKAANYNHWFFLEVNRRRWADALYYVRARPLDYAANVLEGLKDVFTPSTTWHPLDDTESSPHYQPRQVLGRYEAIYNRIVHGLFLPPVGLYALLPFVWVWTFMHARSLVRTGGPDAVARGSLLFFCLFQIAFVVAASSLFTFRESARYRYQVESMIWLIGTLCLVSLGRSLRERVSLLRPDPNGV
jgi:4-amino-4-deoxy-L-arabinose transferase-like glycosyltransferase